MCLFSICYFLHSSENYWLLKSEHCILETLDSLEFLSSPYYSFCFYVYDSYLETILLSPKSDAWQMKWNPSVSFYASCVVNEKKMLPSWIFFFFNIGMKPILPDFLISFLLILVKIYNGDR